MDEFSMFNNKWLANANKIIILVNKSNGHFQIILHSFHVFIIMLPEIHMSTTIKGPSVNACKSQMLLICIFHLGDSLASVGMLCEYISVFV